jgi:hypothetical protein
VFSIGEIRKGIASLPASNGRAVLEDWLDNEIMPWLGDRVLPVTLAIRHTGRRGIWESGGGEDGGSVGAGGTRKSMLLH